LSRPDALYLAVASREATPFLPGLIL